MGEMKQSRCDYQPTEAEISDLIGRARKHPLGTAFLTEGSLDSVAATFKVHAFVVDAARESLGAGSSSSLTQSSC